VAAQAPVLFVHAHPDDETIVTGGTLALMAEAGADVALLTCTRGELGEVIPPSLAHLEGDGAALAAHREGELAAALDALGVRHHLFLGAEGARAAGLAPRRYTDSGMVWGDDGRPRPVPTVASESLCAATFDAVVADVLAAIASTGAGTVVSYDADGGYGHPDHVIAHRAAREAASIAAVPFHAIIDDPAELERLEAAAVAEPDVTLFDVTPVLPAKIAALRAHATQVTVGESEAGATFALSSGPARPVGAREGFRLLDLPVEDDDAPDSGDPRPETWPSRLASMVVALVVGALVGILLTINHQHHVSIAGATIPLGLIACLVIVTALLIGMRLVFSSRLVALAAAVGVVGVTTLLSQEGPGGSVLVPANMAGFIWAYAPMLVAVVVLAWPRFTSPGRARMEVQSRQEGPAS
jgi:N-acetyl-1-D-myo-inositol-2-amino-2-deoxy-alpha-D-glucopyranoside deacetylase